MTVTATQVFRADADAKMRAEVDVKDYKESADSKVRAEDNLKTTTKSETESKESASEQPKLMIFLLRLVPRIKMA